MAKQVASALVSIQKRRALPKFDLRITDKAQIFSQRVYILNKAPDELKQVYFNVLMFVPPNNQLPHCIYT